MRLLLSLCVVGVVVYALLPPRPGPEDNAVAGISTARTETNPQAARQLRSWGTTLQSLGRQTEPQPAASQQSDESLAVRQEAAYRSGVKDTQDLERTPGAGDAAVFEAKTFEAKTFEAKTFEAKAVEAKAPEPTRDAMGAPVGWARVVLAARAHSEPSVSSPIAKFYPRGTELQIVGRESAWIQLLDPVTQERGWVFDKYLVATEGPRPVEAAAKLAAEPRPAKVAAAKAPTSRPSSQPAVQAATDTEVSQLDRRQYRWARKEARRGLFRFFRGGDAGPVAWSLGPLR